MRAEPGGAARRTVVITGASSGIGRVAAARLAADGARVALVGRDPGRTHEAADEFGAEAFVADFDRLAEVHALAEALLSRYDRIDVLMNNAGGLVRRRELTEDGNERTFQSNHLAPFLLTNLLLDRLRSSAAFGAVRVISTASSAHRYGRLRFDDLDWARRPWLGGWGAYGAAKLAVVLFIRELGARLAGTGVSAYAVHPGVVATRFGHDLAAMRAVDTLTRGRYALSAERGAVPLIALAGPEAPAIASGSYVDRMHAGAGLAARARGPLADEQAAELWRVSARLTGLVGTDSGGAGSAPHVG